MSFALVVVTKWNFLCFVTCCLGVSLLLLCTFVELHVSFEVAFVVIGLEFMPRFCSFLWLLLASANLVLGRYLPELLCLNILSSF